ncbi:hypothetical protein [Pectobacterium sp. LFLA-215]|uniref:hypothetical protein n=1 Tax=Pectobacterium sp. LFLA-215 TaxID=3419008 RepID=UPI003F5AE9AA
MMNGVNCRYTVFYVDGIACKVPPRTKTSANSTGVGAVTGAGVGNVAGATTSTIISGAAGTKLPKPAADMLGSTFGAAVSEGTGTVIQKAIDKKPQDQQGK